MNTEALNNCSMTEIDAKLKPFITYMHSVNINDYHRTHEKFLSFLRSNIAIRSELKEFFVAFIYRYGKLLLEEDSTDLLFQIYQNALELYPDSAQLCTNFGAICLRYNVTGSELLLKQAYALDPDYLPAEVNLYSWKEQCVERWHFKMLNNLKRNKAYSTAIEKIILEKHKNILDIGSGCGLLSIYASRMNHEPQVTAFETNETLYNISKKVLQKNCCSNIDVKNVHSTAEVNTEIAKCDLLVTEIFDAAFFGEHALSTLIHAWENLLKPNADIIPASVDLHITGIDCEELIKSKILSKKNVFGLDGLCCYKVDEDPYDAENLLNFNVKYRTNTNVLHIDLKNVQSLKRLYRGETTTLEFTSIESGILHGFAIWFTLNLGEDISLTTDPLRDYVDCWEHAILFAKHPFELDRDQKLKINLSCESNKLSFEFLEYSNDHEETCVPLINMKCKLLNDEFLNKVFEDLCLALNEIINKQSIVADLSDGPILGLLACKMYNSVCYIDFEEETFIKNFIQRNSLDTSAVRNSGLMSTFLSNESFLDILYIEPVTSIGLLSNNYEYSLLKKCLKPNGLLFPYSVTLVLEAVESEYAKKCIKVDDSNLCGVKAAEIFNEYSNPELCNVDVKKWPLKKLSHPVNSINVLRDDIDLLVSEHEIEISSNGMLHGVLYWFDINLYGDVCFKTIDTDYYKSVIIVFDDDIPVTAGEKIKVSIKQQKGCLKVSIL